MDCFHDFCLACDKACFDGPYCSQACKLLDLEKANVDQSPPTSPRNTSHPAWPSSRIHSSTSYSLTPAYVFDSDRSRDSYFARTMTVTATPATTIKSSHQSSRRLLSPSSSHTSLSSTSSNTTASATGMTEQARAELQGYFSTFDQVRAARRRSSLR